MYADDANLFHSHQDINTLFSTVNVELEKIELWFKANKLLLSIKITKYTLFHKNSSKDNIALKLPHLKIEIPNIVRNSPIKILGVMLDEHIIWRDYMRAVESKLAKNFGLLHRVRQALTDASSKAIYFPYIHSYLNYENISLLQMRCERIALNEDFRSKENFAASRKRPLLWKANALNVFQINT